MIVIGAILLSLPIALGVYAYVIYLAILRVMAMRGVPDVARRADTPLITVVIPAYNEELQIRGAIEAVLMQDYPPDRLQILVLSDASTDRTDDIVREFSWRGVELMRMPVRAGKTSAENASLARIRGDIVINTDASVRLDRNAVRLLVDSMADPYVGVASTRDISIASGTNAGNLAEAKYVGYEMAVRSLETRTGGIVGASGSGYAIRASLHRLRVREDLSRDFSAALNAHRHGFRSISVEDAVCYVPRASSPVGEYRRKVRTISRGMETLYFNRDLLNPFKHGAFAWKLLSHKLCRWLLPVSTLPAVVGLAILARSEPWSRGPLALGFVLLGLAVAGASRNGDALSWFPLGLRGALAANLAVIHSAWRFFHGHEDHVWEPTRRDAISVP